TGSVTFRRGPRGVASLHRSTHHPGPHRPVLACTTSETDEGTHKPALSLVALPVRPGFHRLRRNRSDRRAAWPQRSGPGWARDLPGEKELGVRGLRLRIDLHSHGWPLARRAGGPS